MTDASSKIRRSEVESGGFTNKNISTSCALCISRPGIPCSRSVVISVPVTRQRRHLETIQNTMCLTQLPEVVNVTISQECIAKNASGVIMRMNKP